jgi:NAD(P)-dependent dehydrogenase (short-subunit alcohol dehydrogenase family)
VRGVSAQSHHDPRSPEEVVVQLTVEGKTALITGASQGIGREVARALCQEGAKVALVAQNSSRLEAAQRYALGDGGRRIAHIRSADLTLLGEVERVVSFALDRLGNVDFFIHSAARNTQRSLFALSDEQMDEAWQTKVRSCLRLVRSLRQPMRERGGGHIILMTGATARTPSSDFLAGSMANAALVNFARGASRELARDNIRINAISPGWTLTEGLLRRFEREASAQGVSVDDIIAREALPIPLRRLVTTQEIATLTLMLLSGALPSLTGEEIILDGGATPSI